MSTLEAGLPELLGTPTVSDLGLNPVLQSGTGFGSDVADFGPDEMGEEPGLEQELVSLGYTPEQIERVIDYYGAKIQEAIDDNQWIEVKDLDAFFGEIVREIEEEHHLRLCRRSEGAPV
ncbi:MAG: hypothetical protein ACRC10_06505 [Thermoguttaceae bacterium]